MAFVHKDHQTASQQSTLLRPITYPLHVSCELVLMAFCIGTVLPLPILHVVSYEHMLHETMALCKVHVWPFVSQ